VKTSEAAAKEFSEPVALIFIDGAHEYKFVKQDFNLWFPKLLEEGVICFHDTICWPGPKKFVSQFVYRSKRFKNVNFCDSITYATKVKQNSLFDRIRNRYALLMKNIYEISYQLSNKFKIPKPVRSAGKKFINSIH